MKIHAIAALVLGASALKLEQKAPPCVYLDETQAELDKQIDLFSKTLDVRHWTNVLNIAGALKEKSGVAPKLQVHTWELLDKAFTFPRIRRYAYVQENMDMLEHFEDNLNTKSLLGIHTVDVTNLEHVKQELDWRSLTHGRLVMVRTVHADTVSLEKSNCQTISMEAMIISQS
jgi:hypothetical protein